MSHLWLMESCTFSAGAEGALIISMVHTKTDGFEYFHVRSKRYAKITSPKGSHVYV